MCANTSKSGVVDGSKPDRDAYPRHALAEQGSGRQRVRAAAGDADRREPLDAELVSDRPSVGRGIATVLPGPLLESP